MILINENNMSTSLRGMTSDERNARSILRRQLRREGFVTYAALLQYFYLQRVDTDKFVGYTIPAEHRIVISSRLSKDMASTTVRHEILHNFLQHEKRMIEKLSKDLGINIDGTAKEREENIKKVKKILYSDGKFNVAGDLEISNRAYNDYDKSLCRRVELGDKIVQGLVTEDFTHDNNINEDWTNLSMEEMYDKLTDVMKAERNDALTTKKPLPPETKINRKKVIHGKYINPALFVNGDGKKVEPIKTLDEASEKSYTKAIYVDDYARRVYIYDKEKNQYVYDYAETDRYFGEPWGEPPVWDPNKPPTELDITDDDNPPRDDSHQDDNFPWELPQDEKDDLEPNDEQDNQKSNKPDTKKGSKEDSEDDEDDKSDNDEGNESDDEDEYVTGEYVDDSTFIVDED